MSSVKFIAIKSAILFTAIVVTLMISLIIPALVKAQSDQIIVKHGTTYIITKHGDLVDVKDSTKNVENAVIPDDMTSDATNFVAKTLRIPAMLPSTACPVNTECIEDHSFDISNFVNTLFMN